jgi:anti-anti-sigma factor
MTRRSATRIVKAARTVEKGSRMSQVDRFAVFPELHITVDPMPDRAIRVRVAGEVTLDNVAQLRTVLHRAIDDVRASVVEVDLNLVTFIDSTAMGKLVMARAYARTNDSDLWIVNPGSGVRRVLSMLGLLEVLGKPDRTADRTPDRTADRTPDRTADWAPDRTADWAPPRPAQRAEPPLAPMRHTAIDGQ